MKSLCTKFKLFTKVVKHWQITSLRWKSENSEESIPILPKRDTIFDNSVDFNDRGIYSADSCDWEQRHPEPRVIIIGAGMAGIAAAARLSEHGFHNYVILEALDRVGGRIQSSWIGDTVAELGAQGKVDTASINPVFQLSATEEPPWPGEPAAMPTRGLFERAASGNMQFAPVFTAYKKFRQIIEEADSIYCLGGSKQHGSLLNFISLRIQQELHSFPEDHQHDAARIMFGLSHLISARGGSDTRMIAHDCTGYFMNIPGGDVRVPLGLMGIFAPMMRQITGTIRVCKEVNCIYWGTCIKSGHRAIVTCSDGEEFPTDYAIVTVSLGVLYQYAERLFCPALPSSKVDAIRALGFGYCNKIFLEYCQPFWVWQKCNLNFRFFCNELCRRCDWTQGVQYIEPIPYSKHVLCVWVVGEAAVHVEGLSDKDVAEGLTILLRDLTGETIPYPASVLKSHWVADPCFCGSYSYSIDCPNGDPQRALAAPLPSTNDPVPPILLFAGEHTCPGHSATVAGARISGIREADRILHLTQQFEGPPVPYEYLPLNKQPPKQCGRILNQNA